MASQHDRAWLTASELARMGNFSQQTARRWIRRELGKKVGGRLRADRQRAEQFLKITATGAADDRRRA